MSELQGRILVVEDDAQLRRFLRTSLDAHGYEAVEAENGRRAVALMTTERLDAVLLDLGLPDLDGVEVVRQVRQWSQIPIIVVSSRTGEDDKIAALDQGADDYVTKPFSMAELLARIRAAIRHGLKREGVEPIWRSGPLEVDLARRVVKLGDAPVRLSRKEYELLRYFVVHADKLVTHEPVLKEIWGPAQAHETQYLRVFVGRLRQKIEPDPAQPTLLVTEPGVGYRLRTLARG
jgi:two-component system KDP operon response regulator KdpE